MSGHSERDRLRALLRSAASDAPPRGAKGRVVARLEEQARTRWFIPRGFVASAVLVVLALAAGSRSAGDVWSAALAPTSAASVWAESPAPFGRGVEGPAVAPGDLAGAEGAEGSGSSGGGAAGYSGSSSG
jgi:hypothetical protein